jgi:probable phosphoglycerate mutase
MTILLIRHGETALNVARVLQPPDTPLSERGERQAAALAARLAERGVALVLSSDHRRALQTAEAIARVTGAPLQTSELLRERDFGDWRGQPYDALARDPLAMREAPPGGESADAFEARVALAFERIVGIASALPGPLAVVTHGLVVRRMLARHIRLAAGAAQPVHLGNTGLSEFAATAPHLARLVDSTAHLDALLRDDPTGLSGG